MLYASGAGAPDGALAALARVRAARRPTLLVLDDLDHAGEAVLGALSELTGELGGLPVFVVVIAEDAELRDGAFADATLCLAPLDAEAVRAIAELYADERDDAAAAAERLVRDSGGIPQRVHQLAAEWARGEAARRVSASASQAATERAGLRATEDQLASAVVRLQALGERAQLRELTPEMIACPFKGLASFEVDDAEFFYGRERLVAEMVARLAGAPLMGIVGPSGSGKSSALRAGLLPALAAGVLPGSEAWALALLRPGEHPLRALEEAITEASTRGRLVIAVDQFEEAFTGCRDETERAAFVEALIARARDPRRRTVVLVAVRADFYGRCASYPELWRLLGANQCPVGPMRRDELRRAIELPAQRAGLRVERDLVDALIADVEGQPGALPLLSAALLELWQQRDERRLRLSTYREAGGVHRAVARLAERAYERLDAQQQEVARRILLRLAGEGEGDAVVRRRVRLDEIDGEGVGDVLSVLADARLVTIGAGEVEVAHEALLREWPRLRGWLEEDAEGRHLHHQLRGAAREWDAGGRDPGELYRGARLAAALDWFRGNEADLNATERAFLDTSRAAGERSQRRLRAGLAGVAALLVLAVIAGLVALGQRGRARDEATAADAQRLGARALVEPEFDRSLLLARQGVALDDTVQTRGNLLAALLKSPAALSVFRPTGQSILSVALSPDDRTLTVGDDGGSVTFYDALTRRRLATLKPRIDRSASPEDSGTYALAYSPDGRWLAVAQGEVADQRVTVLDARSRRVVARLDIPRRREVVALRYSADGQTLAAVLSDFSTRRSELVRLDPRTGRRRGPPVDIARGRPTSRRQDRPLACQRDERWAPVGRGRGDRDDRARRAKRAHPAPHPRPVGRVTASALSPDDRTLAVGGDDGSLHLVNLGSGEARKAAGPHGAAVNTIAFTPDGRTVITGNVDGQITSWDLRRAEAAETFTGHAGAVRSFAVTSDGRTLYSGGLDRSVFAWDLAGARRLGRPFRAGSPNHFNPRYALSADGRLIATGQNDGAVSVVDARTLKPRKQFPVVTTRYPKILGIGFVPGSHRSGRRQLHGLPRPRRRRFGSRAPAPARSPRVDLDAGHQRRRPAARDRRHRSRCALLVAARRPPARVTAPLPAASARRATEPRRPLGHGGVRQQAGDLGRSHAAPRSQRQERRRHRYGTLLARRPAARDRQPERRAGVVHRELDAGHAHVLRARRTDLLGHDQPRQPHAVDEQLGRHRATLGHRERTVDRCAAARPTRTWRHRAADPGRQRGHRRLRHRTGVPLGHPPRIPRPPGMPDRRPHAHARGMGRVPPRPRLRAGLRGVRRPGRGFAV